MHGIPERNRITRSPSLDIIVENTRLIRLYHGHREFRARIVIYNSVVLSDTIIANGVFITCKCKVNPYHPILKINIRHVVHRDSECSRLTCKVLIYPVFLIQRTRCNVHAKMEHGRLELEHIGFDLHENLRRICRVHSKILRRKGLYFQPPRYADIPRLVRGDPMRFRQILHNLLTNATKFTEEGGVTVTASCGTRRGQPSLEITVRDTGIGMSVEEQQKLFQPFSQVDGSITRRFGGSGLGLTIVKKLIVLMGGEIEVHSAPTIGSVFSFWLPLEEADAVEEELQNRSVFLNPHFEQRNTGQGKVPPGQQPVPKINPVKAEQDDLGDIRSLLAYCEGKLEDGNADTSAETGADHPEQQGGISK